MNTKFISVSLGFIIVGLILVSFFWRQEMLLTILLVLMLIVKHKILPIKKEFTLFVIAGVSGTMVESLIMLAGPWSYAKPNLLNFPIWLPFLWGNAGILGVTLYLGIIKQE